MIRVSDPAVPIVATNVEISVQTSQLALQATTQVADVATEAVMPVIEIQNIVGNIQIEEIDNDPEIIRVDNIIEVVEQTGLSLQLQASVRDNVLVEPDIVTEIIENEKDFIQIVYQGAPGPPGPRGPAGNGNGASTYIYEQPQASTIWTITHNLNAYPSVTVVDSGGNQLWADVSYLSLNTLKVTFAYATGGTAYLN